MTRSARAAFGLGLTVLVSAVPAGLLEPGGLGSAHPVGSTAVRLDPALLRRHGVVRLEGFAIAPGEVGVVVLERFSITRPGSRFVVGHRGAPDSILNFDPGSVTLLRGEVEGRPGSHVFLAVSDYGCRGTLQLAPGEETRLIASAAEETGRRRDGSIDLVVGPRSNDRGAWPVVPMCGLNGPVAPMPAAADGPESPQGGGPIRGLQQLEIAVETDFEYFEQVGEGDLDKAAAYAVMLYGAVSDIYIRDVNTRVDLSFLRLWDSPNDLFNEPDPLGAFRDHWEAFMGQVKRDTAQFCSGRRDLPAGGVAWVSVLCSDYGYSWVGYVNGLRPSAFGPYISDYDIMVTAHELGHNCGTLHTQDYGIDTCHDPATPPRRGGIMSYCGQTFSGSNLNMDMRFETLIQGKMEEHIFSRTCIANDCNGNGVRDGQDIQNGTSADANGNGEPDECEDCNGNGVLDSADIGQGQSADLNANGVPDECEQDCNGNGVPDDLDIAEGVSADTYMDGIPDECQADCDSDGTMDYDEIQADMSLDVDRNAALDACQDCDGDGVTDFAFLGHSRNIVVASLSEDALREFYSGSGVLTQVSAPGSLAEAQDLIVTPDGQILVSSLGDGRIAEFNAAGQFVGNLVGPGGGGLSGPTAMALTPGTLLVSGSGTDSVLEFNLADGAFIREVVAPGAGGLDAPFGLAVSPAGTLVVTSADNRVLEFNLETGQFIRELASAGEGGLSSPRCIAYKPDGNLLVVSYDNRSALEYDGATGAFIGKWNRGGTEDKLVLEEPWGIRIGPDGDVYISTSHVHRDDPHQLHLTKARIFQFDIRNGNLLRAYVEGDDTNLYHPSGFDFLPASADDCNANNRPDSCDIAAGLSQDTDGDGVPDECQCYADCDRSGSLDLFDFLCFQNAFVEGGLYADCDADQGLDLFDFLCFQNAFVAGCK